jgi:hypothetical protein
MELCSVSTAVEKRAGSSGDADYSRVLKGWADPINTFVSDWAEKDFETPISSPIISPDPAECFSVRRTEKSIFPVLWQRWKGVLNCRK